MAKMTRMYVGMWKKRIEDGYTRATETFGNSDAEENTRFIISNA